MCGKSFWSKHPTHLPPSPARCSLASDWNRHKELLWYIIYTDALWASIMWGAQLQKNEDGTKQGLMKPFAAWLHNYTVIYQMVIWHFLCLTDRQTHTHTRHAHTQHTYTHIVVGAELPRVVLERWCSNLCWSSCRGHEGAIYADPPRSAKRQLPSSSLSHDSWSLTKLFRHKFCIHLGWSIST